MREVPLLTLGESPTRSRIIPYNDLTDGDVLSLVISKEHSNVCTDAELSRRKRITDRPGYTRNVGDRVGGCQRVPTG